MMMVMTTMTMTTTDNSYDDDNDSDFDDNDDDDDDGSGGNDNHNHDDDNKKQPDVYISILRTTTNTVLGQNESQPLLATTHSKQITLLIRKIPHCCIIQRKHW
jgi:hypothetical protein